MAPIVNEYLKQLERVNNIREYLIKDRTVATLQVNLDRCAQIVLLYLNYSDEAQFISKMFEKAPDNDVWNWVSALHVVHVRPEELTHAKYDEPIVLSLRYFLEGLSIMEVLPTPAEISNCATESRPFETYVQLLKQWFLWFNKRCEGLIMRLSDKEAREQVFENLRVNRTRRLQESGAAAAVKKRRRTEGTRTPKRRVRKSGSGLIQTTLTKRRKTATDGIVDINNDGEDEDQDRELDEDEEEEEEEEDEEEELQGIQNETRPAEPMRPAGPAEPMRPAETVEPVEPMRPAEPTRPEESTRPAESTRPVDPAEPTRPAEPAEPMRPAEPVDNRTDTAAHNRSTGRRYVERPLSAREHIPRQTSIPRNSRRNADSSLTPRSPSRAPAIFTPPPTPATSQMTPPVTPTPISVPLHQEASTVSRRVLADPVPLSQDLRDSFSHEHVMAITSHHEATVQLMKEQHTALEAKFSTLTQQEVALQILKDKYSTLESKHAALAHQAMKDQYNALQAKYDALQAKYDLLESRHWKLYDATYGRNM